MIDTTDDLAPLIARIALQDRRALRELYDATASRLYAIALRMLRDRAAAEDVLQDAFVTVWSRAAHFPVLHSQPMAWLTTIVRHRAIDVLRRVRDVDVPESEAFEVADEAPGPFENVAARQSDLRLGDCMKRLDAEPRLAVTLAYYEGLTHEALAAKLGRPLGTVKAWVRRSLMRLKDCIGAVA